MADNNPLLGLLGYGRDVAQGASNAIASNVSAPVDGLAWLLRKAGVPMPANPVGGSDWMAQRGLTPEPQNRLAGLLGEFGGMAGPMVAAAKAPQLARGLLNMYDNAAAPRTMNPQRGVIGPFHNEVLGSVAKGVPDDVAAAAFGHDGFVYHTPYRPFENSQATAIGGGTPISERLFTTQKPLTSSQIRSIEAVPVSDGSINSFSKELAEEGAFGFLNKDGKRFSVVTPSAKTQGQFQATQYDPKGAIGDSQHQTAADAIRRLIDGGYSKILNEDRIGGLIQKVMTK